MESEDPLGFNGQQRVGLNETCFRPVSNVSAFHVSAFRVLGERDNHYTTETAALVLWGLPATRM